MTLIHPTYSDTLQAMFDYNVARARYEQDRSAEHEEEYAKARTRFLALVER